MSKSKYFEPSSLAGYGIILSTINQIVDVNELGAVGDAMTGAAVQGGSPSMILMAALVAAIGAIFKSDGAKK